MDNNYLYQGGVTISDTNPQRLTQTITTNIQKISQNVSAMRKMVGQLQTAQDATSVRNQLRQIQAYTQNLAKDTSNLVLELMRGPTPDEPAARLARERLSDEYITTLNAFQDVQRLAAQRERDDMKRARAKSSPVTIGAPGATSPLGPMKFSDQQLIEMDAADDRKQQQLTIQTEQELRELEERERDIRQLESDIVDVNQIFKELGSMIHDQGATIDSIESSVEHTSHTVEAATHQLREASVSKNKLRKKKVYLTIILSVIISIILIIIFSR